MGGTSDSPMGGINLKMYLVKKTIGSSNWIQPVQIEWENNIGGVGEDEQFSIIQTQDGGYFLGGFSTSPVSSDKTEDAIGSGFWTVKLSADGEIEWQNTIEETAATGWSMCCRTRAASIFWVGLHFPGISGDKESTSFGFWGFWAIQLNESG